MLSINAYKAIAEQAPQQATGATIYYPKCAPILTPCRQLLQHVMLGNANHSGLDPSAPAPKHRAQTGCATGWRYGVGGLGLIMVRSHAATIPRRRRASRRHCRGFPYTGRNLPAPRTH
jgi:hypothetical protein